MLGDFNDDGDVNAADYVMGAKLGYSAADMAAWRANYGMPTCGDCISPMPEPVAYVTTPEPAAGLIVAVLVLIFAFWLQRGERGKP